MSAVRPVWMGLRLMAAGIAYLVCFVAAYGLVVRGTLPSPGVEPISPGLALLLVSGLNTVVHSVTSRTSSAYARFRGATG